MAKKQSAIDKLLGRNKPEHKPEPEAIDFVFEQENEEPKVEEFMEIGGSPVPGITLRQILRGHTDAINRIAWSPDGRYLASPSDDETVRIWDVENRECIGVLEGHTSSVYCAAWSPDGQLLSTGSNDRTIRIWNFQTRQTIRSFEDHTDSIYTLSWSPSRDLVGAASGENGSPRIWDLVSGNNKQLKNADGAFAIDWSPSGKMIASGDWQQIISIWNGRTGELLWKFDGHSNVIRFLTWSNDEKTLMSSSDDNTIRIWDVKTRKALRVLEGHQERVNSISLAKGKHLLVSKSNDNTVLIWSTDTWQQLAKLNEASSGFFDGAFFSPTSLRLATHGKGSTVIRIWDINYDVLIGNTPITQSVHYTTAKLVLVGDSGVGKTGLGWRLAHNEFKEHSSTHGQQFWIVPELKKTRDDGTECEAVLWDLAGQHIYRSIHSIFLDDVDASLVLFDPTNRQEPLKGAQFWLEQLKGKKQLPPSVLVGARLDRGAPVLSQQELDQFCQKYGISGGYIGTSAKSGEGLDKLLESLEAQIPWDQMTTTVTTVTFKKIKDYVLSLKEKTDRKGVLVHPAELREQLQATDEDWDFTDAEMMTAVGHLANHGYVIILNSSAGEQYILLVPELLASVAASIFLHADKHPRELGAINETELLQGKYAIDEFKGLEKEEQQILLDATVIRFLEHSLCFRETLGNDNLLIFPSLIKQRRPLKDDVPSTDDISYIVRGRVENIYAVLVVLLGYTPSFTRINQWQNQAQYETDNGNICGFRLVEDREGEIELILYYDDKMPRKERNDFQALFEQFLYKRDVEVIPFPPVICPNGHRQERALVVKRSQEGKKSIFCDECGAKTDLPDLEAQSAFGFEVPEWLKSEEAIARLRGAYEARLVNIKGYRRDWATPRCYISHAEEQNELAERLAHDLADAGIFFIEDVSEVELNDNIIIINSEAYKKAWENNIISDDVKKIQPRFADDKQKGLISINISGMILEHNIEECKPRYFHDPTHYVINLFDLILNLYAIPLSHAGFLPLRQTLHQQWEQTLAKKMKWESIPDETNPSGESKKEIYISYAWGGESEKIVNELDQAFQKRGVTIIRDNRDLGFKGRIKGFMETIGEGKAVVLVISEKYLESENCLFELLQIAKYGDFEGRIFPVVLEDARIYKAVDRIRYVQFWEQQLKELDDAMKTVSATNMQGFREDIDLFAEIRANLSRLTDILKDMNTLTPTIHRDADFQTLFDAVMAKLEE